MQAGVQQPVDNAGHCGMQTSSREVHAIFKAERLERL
jgi:hypothetical protein